MGDISLAGLISEMIPSKLPSFMFIQSANNARKRIMYYNM